MFSQLCLIKENFMYINLMKQVNLFSLALLILGRILSISVIVISFLLLLLLLLVYFSTAVVKNN